MSPEEEVQLLERLIDELLAGIVDVIQSGGVLSDDMQGVIAKELEATTSRIGQLRLGAPPSPDAQLLWILAGQQEQPFISYLRDYPSPATQALLNNPAELNRTIEFLNKMMPKGEQPWIDGIQHSDLNSSNIWGTAYNPKTGQMKVRFQGGAEYEYDGVPPNIYKAFSKGNAAAKTIGSNKYGAWFIGKNPSMGAAMNQYIKQGGFNYRRIK